MIDYMCLKNHIKLSRKSNRYNSSLFFFTIELTDKVRRDSAYSSNQERINIQQSIYEPLSECYSGYSLIQSDFLTPNVSSLQSTTDEAYESEPTTATTSPRSPAMSSSIATTTHIHPDLEHEFEYPSPPPPIPDRRLKPAHLRPPPPPPPPPPSTVPVKVEEETQEIATEDIPLPPEREKEAPLPPPL